MPCVGLNHVVRSCSALRGRFRCLFLSSKGAAGVSPARKGRASDGMDSSPNGASGLVLVAHFGASRKKYRNPALPGRANTGRPIGPKTSSHRITITLGDAKYNHSASTNSKSKFDCKEGEYHFAGRTGKEHRGFPIPKAVSDYFWRINLANELDFSISCSISKIGNALIFGYSFAIINGEVIGESDNESTLYPLYQDLKRTLSRLEAGTIAEDIDLLQELKRVYVMNSVHEPDDRCFHITLNTDPFLYWYNIAAVTSSTTIDIAYRIGEHGQPKLVRLDKTTIEKSIMRFVESFEQLQRLVLKH